MSDNPDSEKMDFWEGDFDTDEGKNDFEDAQKKHFPPEKTSADWKDLHKEPPIMPTFIPIGIIANAMALYQAFADINPEVIRKQALKHMEAKYPKTEDDKKELEAIDPERRDAIGELITMRNYYTKTPEGKKIVCDQFNKSHSLRKSYITGDRK